MDIASTPGVTPPDGRKPAVDSVWGRDGFGFDDLLDIVNPLQHLPGVGQLYRHVTGDEIGMLPQIAGGLLFGGPIGAATSVVSAGVEAGTGKTPAAHALAALAGEPAVPPPPTRVARAYAPPSTDASSGPSTLPATPTPHAATPATGTAAAPGVGTAIEAGTPPVEWTPPLSSASARLMAQLERSVTTTG
jgi:hypothetical protein